MIPVYAPLLSSKCSKPSNSCPKSMPPPLCPPRPHSSPLPSPPLTPPHFQRSMASLVNGKSGIGMKNINAGVSGNPTLLDAVSGCAGAMCGMVETMEGSRKNQRIVLRMGAADDLLTIQSPFAVQVGDVVAVAPVGAAIGDDVVTQPVLLDEVQVRRCMEALHGSMVQCTHVPSHCTCTLTLFKHHLARMGHAFRQLRGAAEPVRPAARRQRTLRAS